MESNSNDELPGQVQTPTRGSVSSRRKDEELEKDVVKKGESEEDAPKKEDEGEDESFVTMDEIKDNSLSEDPDFYAKLGYGPLLTQEGKRPSKVVLQDYYFEETGQVNRQKGNDENTGSEIQPRQSSYRRFSHRLSREFVRRRSSVVETLPETPAGWTVLISGLASALLGYELHLQQKLSCPPWVFAQCGSKFEKDLPLQAIFERLTQTPESLLSRPINPSLFVGTRGTFSSVAAYAMHGPSKKQHLCFRQVLTMSTDGARIGLDWELPPDQTNLPDHERKQQCFQKGGIQKPLMLVMTGMNNDTSFGYIKSLQRTFTNRGWIAVAMNFRGVGGVPLTTPRCYNGGYTGDLRCVVQYLSSRLAHDVPLFIVGNSLSANIVTKYLGEEGLSGTLPSNVAGGAALGNPLLMHVNNLSTPWKEVLALGVKKDVLLNWPTFRHMTVPSFRHAIANTLKARTIGDVDEALSSIFIRNESHYPFAVRIGFNDAEHYWADSSSFKYIKHISVPCLQIVAGDDMIVYKSFQKKLAHCIQNPYVMCVETKCGGHLGWQESPPPDSNGVGASWADRATADFFDAIIKTGTSNHQPASNEDLSGTRVHSPSSIPTSSQSDDIPRFRSKL